LEITGKELPLQCVFHSIRFKVNKKIGCLGEIAFFYVSLYSLNTYNKKVRVYQASRHTLTFLL
jgi:hypothetical protein